MPLIQLQIAPDLRVHILEDLFADFADLRFGGIYESALRVCDEVVLMVFDGAESVEIAVLLYPVCNVKRSGDVFSFFIYQLFLMSVRYPIILSYIVLQQFFVEIHGNFIDVIGFVGHQENFITFVYQGTLF